MSESIQQKLLRVRPPRVKITYDVEIGSAQEKRELPFIAGIFADLSGDRDSSVSFPIVKDRRMQPIDRDNFNDLMASIGPRVGLSGLPNQLSGDPNATLSGSITFGAMEDFEPKQVVQAVPVMNELYMIRGGLRMVQSKGETNDDLAKKLDDLVTSGTSTLRTSLMGLFQPATPGPVAAEKGPLKAKAFTLAGELEKVDTAKVTALSTTWGFYTPATGDGADVTAANAAAAKTAEQTARLLLGAFRVADTDDNFSKAKDLAALLQLPDSDTAHKPARDAAATAAGFANAAAAVTALAPYNAALTGTSADAAAIAAARAMALLLLGLSENDDRTKILRADYPSSAAWTEAINRADGKAISLQMLSSLDKAAGAAKGGVAAQLDGIRQIAVMMQNTDDDIARARTLLPMRHFVVNVAATAEALRKQSPDKSGKLTKAAGLIDQCVVHIDEQLSLQLNTVMHSDSFKRVEATWRGLFYLVSRTETGELLKLRIFNATQKELMEEMDKAVEFDQSWLFKMIYEEEYGTHGGEPYSMLVGGYEIGRSPQDIEFLKKMSEIAASAHAPFIAAASSSLFGLDSLDQLAKPRDLEKIFESLDLAGWREFRAMEDSRYVSLVLPHALLRLPYGENTWPAEGLNFEEDVSGPDNKKFLWGNAAYLMAERITNAFSLYSWTACIRGVEGGGLIEGLPLYTYQTDSGSKALFCPTELAITDRREKELNDLGFIALCHCKGTGTAAFFGGQTTNRPKVYNTNDANANAKISARLPYILAASRFAHYIKVIMRDKIGSFLTRENVQAFLNNWIAQYVLLDDNATQQVKANYPLRAANIIVTDIPGDPGSYRAVVFIKPHFQLEELTTSIRLVADLPS